MVVEAQKETLSFQTEVKQLLHLMINSLYSNKEIFMRELISNASDALDKLRFAALSDAKLNENDTDFKIALSFNKDARTVTIRDNGIGMNRDEVIQNLGTIAKSGTKEFIQNLSGDKAKDANLIGQFGVGFYSAFIVADLVTVKSRKAGEPVENGICWESKGDGEYTLESVDLEQRGTEITLHLKEGEDEFLDQYRLRNIITTYSDHISFPIDMPKSPEFDEEGNEKAVEGSETVNKATALWTRNKADVTEEEYKEFYKHVSHDYADPLAWAHNKVEGKYEYTSLFYIPEQAPFDLWNRDKRQGLKLYVQRVYIMDDAEQFMPAYLRFVRGLIDCNDLPLNVSREILQNNKVVESIRNGSVKKVLGLLEKLTDDKDAYAKFWNNFGEVLKEGVAEDMANQSRIAKLIRFATTQSGSAEQTVSLDEYIARMKEGQDKIYYITGETYAAAKSSPHLEIFQKKGIEVLLLSDRVDEWFTTHLSEYEGKKLQSVAKGELNDIDEDISKEETEKTNETHKDLLEKIKAELGDRVKEVRMTHRLTSSPACIVVDEHELGTQMQRILKAAGQTIPDSKPILELNPEHAIIQRLESEQDAARFSDWSHLVFDQAVLTDGGQLEDPAQFVSRMNQLFVDLGLK